MKLLWITEVLHIRPLFSILRPGSTKVGPIQQYIAKCLLSANVATYDMFCDVTSKKRPRSLGLDDLKLLKKAPQELLPFPAPPRGSGVDQLRDVRFGLIRPIWPFWKAVGREILQAHGQPIFGRIWPYSKDACIWSIQFGLPCTIIT